MLSAFLCAALQKNSTDVFPEEAFRVLDKHPGLPSPKTSSAIFFKMPVKGSLISV